MNMSFNKQAPVLNKKVYINNKREKSKLEYIDNYNS